MSHNHDPDVICYSTCPEYPWPGDEGRSEDRPDGCTCLPPYPGDGHWISCALTSMEIPLEDIQIEPPTEYPGRPGHKGQKLARFDLLPWDALWVLAEHYGKGAAKYAARNWERGYDFSDSVAQMGRHLAQIATGELIDPENGSPHAAAIAFGALALIAFELRGIGNNNLPQLGRHLDSEVTNPEDIEAAQAEARAEATC